MTFQNDFQDYNMIVCPFNRTGVHWELCILFPNKYEILYMNPMGETEGHAEIVASAWRKYFRRRQEDGIEPCPGKWKVVTEKHSKQMDGDSCGVFVLKVKTVVSC